MMSDTKPPLIDSLLQDIQDLPEDCVISILRKCPVPLCCQIQKLPEAFHPHAVHAVLPSLQETGTIDLNLSKSVSGKTYHHSCQESEHRTAALVAILDTFSSHARPRFMHVGLDGQETQLSRWEFTEAEDATDTCVHLHIRDYSADRNLLNSVLAPLSHNTTFSGLHIELSVPKPGHPGLPFRVLKGHEESELGFYLSDLVHLKSLSIKGVEETDPTGWLAVGLRELVNLTCLQGCGVQPAYCLAPILREMTALQRLKLTLHTYKLTNRGQIGDNAAWIVDAEGAFELGEVLAQLTQLTALELGSEYGNPVYEKYPLLGDILERCMHSIQGLVHLRLGDSFTGYCRCSYIFALGDEDVQRLAPLLKLQQLRSLAMCVLGVQGKDGIVSVLESLRMEGQCTSLKLYLDTCNDEVAETLVDTICCMPYLSHLELDLAVLQKRESSSWIESKLTALSHLDYLKLELADRGTYDGC